MRALINFVAGRFIEKRVSSIGLSLFRIFFFTIVLLEVLQIYKFRSLIFDIEPFEKAYQMVQISTGLQIWIFSIVMIIIGFQTRLFKLVNFVLMVIFYGGITSTSFEYHHDHIVLTLVFFSLFVPLSKRFSVDAVIRRNTGETADEKFTVPLGYALILALASAGVTYFDSVLTKENTFLWTSGLGVWWIPSRPYSAWLDLSFLLNMESLMYVLCYLTVAFEAAMAFMIWNRYTRVAALIIGAGMHFIIFFAIPIPLFALGMLFIYFLLIPDSWFKFIFRKYYDKGVNIPFINKLADKLNRNTTSHQQSYSYLLLNKNNKKTILFSGILFITINQIILMYTAYTPGREGLDKILSRRSNYHEKLHDFTGMTNHTVVSDQHRHYQYMVWFEYENEKGTKKKFPHYTSEGLYNFWYSGRTYRNYTFDIGGSEIAEYKIRRADRWIKYVCGRENLDLNQGKINVYAKYVRSPETWEQDFLKTEKALPWQKIGEYSFKENRKGDLVLYQDRINSLHKAE